MISINIFRNGTAVTAISVDGHADFAKPGTDIVCAAISALSFCLIESLEELDRGQDKTP